MSRSPTEQRTPFRNGVIGLDSHGMAWLAADDDAQAWEYRSWQNSDRAPQELFDHLRMMAQQNEASKTIWLCADTSLAPQWVQPIPRKTASLQELYAIASARAGQLFGPPQQGAWHVSADWRSEGHVLCCALPSGWHVVGEAMQSEGIVVRWCTPLTLALTHLPQVLESQGWVAVIAGAAAYLLRVQNRQVVFLRVLRWPPSIQWPELQTLILREHERDVLRMSGTEGVASDKADKLTIWTLMPQGMLQARTQSQADANWQLAECSRTKTLAEPDWLDPAAVHVTWLTLRLDEGFQ